MKCKVPQNQIPTVHTKVFYIPDFALEAQDPVSWLALCANKIEPGKSSVPNAYKLGYANWNNSQLDFREITKEDTNEDNFIGDCLPTLASLNAAKYMFVPSDWSGNNLSELKQEPEGTEQGSNSQYKRPSLRSDSDLYTDIRSDSDLYTDMRSKVNTDMLAKKSSFPWLAMFGIGALGFGVWLATKK